MRPGLSDSGLSSQVKQRWKKVRRHIKYHETLDDAARHAWRIEVKKLRYAVDFFLALFAESDKERRKEAPAYQALKHLTALQDSLGMLNDIAEAQKHNPLSGIAVDLVAKRAERRPELLREVDKSCTALVTLMPFWKGRER